MIRTREQLLDWIACHGTRSMKRALAERTVEVLGGFAMDPPRWIVRLTLVCSPYVSVTGDGRIRIEEFIPWRLWTGGKSPLYQGDNPKRYERLRDTARRLNAKRKH